MKAYTTAEIGVLLGISRVTAAKLIDSGRLTGSKPGGRRRVVLAEDLLAYARQEKLPGLVRRLVLVGGRVVVLSHSADVTRACETRQDVLLTDCWFDLASALVRGRPRGVLLDTAVGRAECVKAAQRLREELERPAIIALVYDDQEGPWDYAIACDQLHRLAEVLSTCERR